MGGGNGAVVGIGGRGIKRREDVSRNGISKQILTKESYTNVISRPNPLHNWIYNPYCTVLI
jgi:hypothetical protein